MVNQHLGMTKVIIKKEEPEPDEPEGIFDDAEEDDTIGIGDAPVEAGLDTVLVKQEHSDSVTTATPMPTNDSRPARKVTDTVFDSTNTSTGTEAVEVNVPINQPRFPAGCQVQCSSKSNDTPQVLFGTVRRKLANNNNEYLVVFSNNDGQAQEEVCPEQRLQFAPGESVWLAVHDGHRKGIVVASEQQGPQDASSVVYTVQVDNGIGSSPSIFTHIFPDELIFRPTTQQLQNIATSPAVPLLQNVATTPAVPIRWPIKQESPEAEAAPEEEKLLDPVPEMAQSTTNIHEIPLQMQEPPTEQKHSNIDNIYLEPPREQEQAPIDTQPPRQRAPPNIDNNNLEPPSRKRAPPNIQTPPSKKTKKTQPQGNNSNSDNQKKTAIRPPERVLSHHHQPAAIDIPQPQPYNNTNNNEIIPPEPVLSHQHAATTMQPISRQTKVAPQPNNNNQKRTKIRSPGSINANNQKIGSPERVNGSNQKGATTLGSPEPVLSLISAAASVPQDSLRGKMAPQHNSNTNKTNVRSPERVLSHQPAAAPSMRHVSSLQANKGGEQNINRACPNQNAKAAPCPMQQGPGNKTARNQRNRARKKRKKEAHKDAINQMEAKGEVAHSKTKQPTKQKIKASHPKSNKNSAIQPTKQKIKASHPKSNNNINFQPTKQKINASRPRGNNNNDLRRKWQHQQGTKRTMMKKDPSVITVQKLPPPKPQPTKKPATILVPGAATRTNQPTKKRSRSKSLDNIPFLNVSMK